MTDSPFSHERDAELGELLRTHLDGQHPGAFVTRVQARLRADRAAGPFEVLGAWMRPGLAAAAVVALLAGWWITSSGATEAVSSTPMEVFAEAGSTDLLLATTLEGR